jgi:hypothetical protein
VHSHAVAAGFREWLVILAEEGGADLEGEASRHMLPGPGGDAVEKGPGAIRMGRDTITSLSWRVRR